MDLAYEEVEQVAVARAAGATWRQLSIALDIADAQIQRSFAPLIAAVELPATLPTAEQALADVRKQRTQRWKAEQALVDAVGHARDVKVTWQEIADITSNGKRSNAMAKFRPWLEGRPLPRRRLRLPRSYVLPGAANQKLTAPQAAALGLMERLGPDVDLATLRANGVDVAVVRRLCDLDLAYCSRDTGYDDTAYTAKRRPPVRG
jgi:hypothetical protein